MQHFEFVLFSTDPAMIQMAITAGVDSIIVDWENIGKVTRQLGADTQINYDTLADLQRVRACTSGRVICRLNGIGAHTKNEIEAAVANGADEILLPMIRSPQEVEHAFGIANQRCGIGILVETVEALECASELAAFPLTRVYIGLMDLAIARGEKSIFSAIIDGTVERMRSQFSVTPFGFGGLTLPDRGNPVPCRLLIGEMTRLGCNFSFLRRSFHRDIQGHDLNLEVPRMRQAIAESLQRNPDQILADQAELWTTIEKMIANQTSS